MKHVDVPKKPIASDFRVELPRLFALDGTACVGKSRLFLSLIERIPRLIAGGINGKIHKAVGHKHLNKMKNSNSLGGVSLFLLSCAFVYKQLDETPEENALLIDRRLANHLDWNRIWRVLKSLPEEEITSLDMTKVKAYFSALCNGVQDVEFGWAPLIIMIDSDVEAVRKRMRKRATGSDSERAELSYYVELQNLYYTCLAEALPNAALFDLQDYNGDMTARNEDIIQYIEHIGTIQTAFCNVWPSVASLVRQTDYNKHVKSCECAAEVNESNPPPLCLKLWEDEREHSFNRLPF